VFEKCMFIAKTIEGSCVKNLHGGFEGGYYLLLALGMVNVSFKLFEPFSYTKNSSVTTFVNKNVVNS
jgi:hypothetical protein